MSRWIRARSALALASASLALAIPANATAQAAPLGFGPCNAAQVVQPVAGLQCATLVVPFDRSNPAAGQIGLAVQRIPPTGPKVGTLVLLAGGPGQPALPGFEGLFGALAHEPVLRGFELVAFDQRGTGQSEALICPEPNEPSIGLEGTSFLTRCGAELGATRAFYTSQESVEDLDALRQALGGTPLSLFATSYGGRVAGMYALEHPQGTGRMVLDSPTPVRGPDLLDAARLHALPRVLDEGICGAGACRSFSADPYADLTRLVAKLRRHPIHSRIYDARGRSKTVVITEGDLLGLMLDLDLAGATRELAPAAIAAANHADTAPLAQLASRISSSTGEDGGAPTTREDGGSSAARHDERSEPWLEAERGGSSISTALFIATSCVEDELPWSPASSLGERPLALRKLAGSLAAVATAPFALATVLAASPIQLCLHWPATSPAPAPPSGISSTPTLILSGDDDLRTPYEQDLTIAGGYSHARVLRVPGVGHSTVTTDRSGCARTAMLDFIATGAAPGSCAPTSEPQALPPPPPSLSALPDIGSRSREGARAAAAAAFTIEDLFGQLRLAGGGLHGGYWDLRRGAYILHGLSDVPGVALTGSIRIEGDLLAHVKIAGQLRVRGRVDGALTLDGSVLGGRLDGAAVHTRLTAL